MLSFGMVCAMVILTIIGDYFLKLGSAGKSLLSLHVGAGMLFYAMTAPGWAWLMRQHNLDQVAVFFSGGTLVLLAAMGWFIFDEPLTTRKAIGVVIALVAILVMSGE